MDALLEPFRYEFFRNALAVAGIAGALCGMVGVFVVLRGMSYIGHGLSHAIFGGAVASFVAKINFYAGAGLWGLVSALMIHRVARRRTIGADAAIGVVTTASFAVGIALISRQRSFTRNFEAALFGNVLGVTPQDIVAVGVVALFSAGLIFVRYRALLYATFDPDVAEISGLKTGVLDAVLALILAASILATMQVLGVTLIVAALVVPAVIARMLTDRFARMIQLSTLIGATMGFFGVYLSYYLDIASGPAVVLFGSAGFALVFIVTGARRLRWAPSEPGL
jgi:ABC-type Mn2+/Zn2+ transport system permease subunit